MYDHIIKKAIRIIFIVDTPLTGVDTMLQTQGKIMKNGSSSVDTGGLPEHLLGKTGHVVSTLDQVVSTLETFPEHLLGYSGTAT
ncbi:hypothetical protein Taro_039094 [Colocasia esculenta]|uniref:Uncharacterized protein n=1 Tax=Colocasia esculenta TaxID=4460 RepID=A0A843WL61_COLES|nr:hypothetical protein [Colocasia esculenta]